MSTISEVSADVYRRIEEDPASPKFWVDDEVFSAAVEAMNELCLITGEPEIKQGALMTITANTRFFTIPNGGIVLLRMEGVRKGNAYELSSDKRAWLGETGDALKRWFPFGIGQFGVYPKLTTAVDVSISYIRIPVTMASTYTGSETVPFREEYREAMVDYAHHVLRMKELGQDFADSMAGYDRFLARASELSKFGSRIGKLRFTRGVGSPAPVTDVVTR